MKFELKNNIITLFFEGELNSSNSENVELDIEHTLEGKSFSSMILNFSKLVYISSAGLRLVLKLKQKYKDVKITEVTLEVYDILQMTGFVDILPVSKALKEIDVSNAEVIGTGYFSTVYRVDKDTIIKVFNRTSDPEQIGRELKLSKEAFILGIPTAISYDIVKVGEKLGVRFEMLDCESLKGVYKKHPEKYDEYTDQYVALLKKINTTNCKDESIHDVKQFYLEKIELVKKVLDDEHYQKIKRMVEALPSTMNFVHGDCHFKNIMVQNNEFLLIDMDTLSRGEPIFELAAIKAPYVAFEEDDPGNTEKFLGVPSELAAKLYNDIVERYFGSKDQAIKDKISIVCYLHMVWWTMMNQPDNKMRIEGNKNRLIKLIDQYDDLKI